MKGLPKEEKAPLKVIHYHLDHPKVASVILTNNILDSAKTNRALILIHNSEITDEDIKTLAHGCLFNNTPEEKLEKSSLEFRNGLCEAYQKVNQFSYDIKKNLFQQRDFVYFLRYLNKNCIQKNLDTISFNPTPQKLLRALQRNFNGIKHEQFIELVKFFFEKVNMNIPHENNETIECIKESINDFQDPNENPNTSSFRYIMIIDPSENESSISLLRDFDICKNVIRVHDFIEDNNDESIANIISKIKDAMAMGSTILLTNSSSIDTCFYDVYNRYFTPITTSEGNKKFVANIAIGSHSKACIISPNFKIIVHIPLSKINSTSLPFLNRFEKYYLTIEEALQIELNKYSKMDQNLIYTIKKRCEDMVKKFHFQSCNEFLFYGI